jgi:protein-glutamine gamma-glutamyltransferase
MQQLRTYGPGKTVAHLVFLLLPTIAVVYFLFFHLSLYYSVLQDQQHIQTLYFALGITASTLFYAFRFRFSTTFSLLVLILVVLAKYLNSMGTGEFDAFFISVQFRIFAIIFAVAWLLGWALLRTRYAAVTTATLMLLLGSYVIARTGGYNYKEFSLLLGLIATYAIYLIYTSEALLKVQQTTPFFWIRYTSRTLALILLSLSITAFTISLNKQVIEAQLSNKVKSGDTKDDVTQKDKNGNIEFKDAMSLSGARQKDTSLVMVAHIDNYFEGTDIANPLYLTAYHYSNYDAETQSFVRDSLMPLHDEFTPRPGDLSLLRTKTDSSVFERVSNYKLRKTIEVEIYNRKLSPLFFAAPSTSYFIQTVPVDAKFRTSFVAAYRAKCHVSALNSAYFIYNTKNETIENLQEQRFDILRKARKNNAMDSSFLKYYTSTPTNGEYADIVQLADSLSKGRTTTIDKILAVREFYWQKNAVGKQVYKYSDNPGVPGIPSASKIHNFLFSSKKGYCAYYAGATLMLLRSMGIPSRISVGFLTENRSSGKNAGWYWYYANQAHAWVEVYFPEYGWLDFDTTIDNLETRQSTKPDGTPPSLPEKAPFAITGKLLAIDTSKKVLTIDALDVVFRDKEYTIKRQWRLDAGRATVVADTAQTNIGSLQVGDTISAVSYNKKLDEIPTGTIAQITNALPMPTAVDEVLVKTKVKKNSSSVINKVQVNRHLTLALTILITTSILALLALALPWIVAMYFRVCARFTTSQNTQAYYAHKYISFKLQQFVSLKGDKTDSTFANYVDRKSAINVTEFMNTYQSLKFSNTEIRYSWLQESKFINDRIQRYFRHHGPWHNRINFIKTLSILRKHL